MTTTTRDCKQCGKRLTDERRRRSPRAVTCDSECSRAWQVGSGHRWVKANPERARPMRREQIRRRRAKAKAAS